MSIVPDEDEFCVPKGCWDVIRSGAVSRGRSWAEFTHVLAQASEKFRRGDGVFRGRDKIAWDGERFAVYHFGD